VNVPFITYKTQERRFRAFLAEYTDLSRAEIRKEAEDEYQFITRELTYTQVKEIFDAGWDAAEAEIKRRKR
jgi:hypothetical protein